MIGVSPAYFISRYTDRFTDDDIVASLPDIKAMGYDGFEPEIFHVDMITAWRNGGAANVRDAARDSGLVPTQFVAHFLTKGFDTSASLASPFGLAEIKKVIEILDTLGGIDVVVVPFGAFLNGGSIVQSNNAEAYNNRLVEKLGTMLKYVEESGRTMSLEIMPGSLVGGFEGFTHLCDRLESDTLGINMDTGHANASGEDLRKVCQTMGDKIRGTHLCDNYAIENLSLAPGRADIDFHGIIGDIQKAGYKGSWDVEIICNPAEIIREYSAGLKHIQTILDAQ